MTSTNTRAATGLLLALNSVLLVACSDDAGHTHPDGHAHTGDASAGDAAAGDGGTGDGAAEEAGATVPLTLFASEGETLVSFDVATGAARPGAIANVRGPTDMQALASGHVLVNLTANNEVLVVDTRTFREVTRIKSSRGGATRPVHSFVTPLIGGKQFWAANNDGDGTAATNSVVFIDVLPGSPTFLTAVGELALGIGHHKDAWSPGKARGSISNIADCGNVVQVIDYTDPTKPALVQKWSAMELDPARTCGPMAGVAPHGAAAAANGHGYHNLTGWGAILAIAQDADPPTFKLLTTKGNGGGYTKAGKDGRHVYSLQRTPREGDATRPGADCQLGQLVVIDSTTDTIATEVPLLLTAPCTSKLPAHAAAAGPDHMRVSNDGKTLFITTQAAAAMAGQPATYSDQLLVVDLTTPAQPTQKASITVGKHNGHRGMSLSGDGKHLFVVNNADRTVSQIDVATLAVVRTITLKETPSQLASWGSAEGPSAQTGPL
jgi:YVTN family beta-propeller protein